MLKTVFSNGGLCVRLRFMKKIAKPLLIVIAVYCAATFAHLAASLANPAPTVQDFLSGKSDSLGGFDATL